MTSKTLYPADYTEDDIANYDMLIAQGTNLIGTKLRPGEEWILDLSAKMAINKHKGIDSELTQQEIDKLRELHEKTRKEGVFETPEDYMKDGWIYPTDNTEPYENPLNKPAEYYNNLRLQPPKDVIDPPPVFENDNDNVIEF
jgi:hypothetical protein